FAEVEIKDATLTNAAYNYSPAPGVAIILNSQNNNTEAVIENGELNSGAKLNAGNTITVNATTEQPMNDSTLTLALNIVQAGVDADEL
ncbi:hypothetical protein, partial [Klebsiella pneumoniae]|uniref:hypothetical protein n=1 Tax=Klebsiella pneumoniae TaxID=573 RepID=UPI0025A0ADBC